MVGLGVPFNSTEPRLLVSRFYFLSSTYHLRLKFAQAWPCSSVSCSCSFSTPSHTWFEEKIVTSCSRPHLRAMARFVLPPPKAGISLAPRKAHGLEITV